MDTFVPNASNETIQNQLKNFEKQMRGTKSLSSWTSSYKSVQEGQLRLPNCTSIPFSVKKPSSIYILPDFMGKTYKITDESKINQVCQAKQIDKNQIIETVAKINSIVEEMMHDSSALARLKVEYKTSKYQKMGFLFAILWLLSSVSIFTFGLWIAALSISFFLVFFIIMTWIVSRDGNITGEGQLQLQVFREAAIAILVNSLTNYFALINKGFRQKGLSWQIQQDAKWIEINIKDYQQKWIKEDEQVYSFS